MNAAKITNIRLINSTYFAVTLDCGEMEPSDFDLAQIGQDNWHEDQNDDGTWDVWFNDETLLLQAGDSITDGAEPIIAANHKATEQKTYRLEGESMEESFRNKQGK